MMNEPRTCQSCKHVQICAIDASSQGLDFDLDFEGEAYCGQFEIFTFADKIRSATDEEMAKIFASMEVCPQRAEYPFCGVGARCVDCWLDNLKKPVKEEI